MSSIPPPGASGSGDKQQPNPAASKDQRVSARTEARSSESSGQDDQQAARAQLPRPTLSTGTARAGRGTAGAPSTTDDLSYVLETLSMDLPLIPMNQLPPWAKRMPRKDPVTLRRIPGASQPRLPPHSNPGLTGAAAASQSSHQLPPPRRDDAIIWFMAPSPSRSPAHRHPTLCRFTIRQDEKTTEGEWIQRCKKVSDMANQVLKIRARGGPSHLATQTNDPTDRMLKAWILAADRLHEVMPDPTADTVWVSPLLLGRDTLYRAWVKLFMQIFLLIPPRNSFL